MTTLHRSLLCLTIIGLLLSVLAPAASAASPVFAPGTLAAGEWLVGVRSGTPLSAKLSTMNLDAKSVMQVAGLNVALLTVSADNAAATMRALQDDREVVFIEPNGTVEGAWTPNDPDYSNPSKTYAPQQIKANLAWDLVRGASAIVVAVVDSGADLAHPDLNGVFWTNPLEVAGNDLDDDGNGYVDDVRGWNFVAGNNLPQDDLGHGTHVTGIAAASTNNGIGIAGIAGGIKVMPVKVLDSSNSGTWANVAQGVIYATDMGVKAINLSLGGLTPSATIDAAVQYARSHGVLVIAAAGNGATSDPFYPAAYEGVLGVAATVPGGARWTLSNFGSYVDLAAPGSTVYSTYWKSTTGSTYQFSSGTSMATPMMTGVAALVWSENPALTADQVAAILTSTATDLGDPGWDQYYGYGQVDAQAAVQAAEATLPADSTISGQIWVDLNLDGQRQPSETTGISGAPVRVRNLSTQGVVETLTGAQGQYSVGSLPGGAYEVSVGDLMGYIGTTPTTVNVTLSYAQAATADFGFIAPTAVTVQGLTVTPANNALRLSWQVRESGAGTEWNVLRATGATRQPKSVNAAPVLGTITGTDVVEYTFDDTSVTAGQVYWYWLRNAFTGELYGPVQATARAGGAIAAFLPFVTR